MATPHVSGVAALLRCRAPDVDDRSSSATGSSAPFGRSPRSSARLGPADVVDAGKALSNAPTVLPPADPAPTPVALTPATVADPTPAPATPPAPPVLPEPDVVDSSPADLSAPEIAFDSAGAPFVAYVRRFDGVHLASRLGSNWVDHQLTTAYDDLYWLDLVVGGDDVPQVAVQRVWGDLATYSDPGIVVARAESGGPDVQRVTAACPQADSCFWDWNPAAAADASGRLHVAFTVRSVGPGHGQGPGWQLVRGARQRPLLRDGRRRHVDGQPAARRRQRLVRPRSPSKATARSTSSRG
jgi:hypothetical protein